MDNFLLSENIYYNIEDSQQGREKDHRKHPSGRGDFEG
jgi:hypothetical protein